MDNNISCQQYISIGIIFETHGLKGNVKIKKFAKDIKITPLLNLYIKNNQNVFEKIQFKQINKKADLYTLKINFIESIEEATKYLKQEIYCKKSDITLLKDEFFTDELIGLHVQDQKGNILGKIIEIYNFGASDILEIELNNSKSMIPFTKETFPSIDLCESIVTLKN